MTLTIDQVGVRMNGPELVIWNRMTPQARVAYLEYWNSSTDRHRAHRDALPCFEYAWNASRQDQRGLLIAVLEDVA